MDEDSPFLVKNMYPKIKFQISPQKDIRTFIAFAADAKASGDGRILEWAFFNHYPVFKKYIKDGVFEFDKKFVEKFVYNKYLKNNKLMKQNMQVYQKNWKKLEKDYFELVDQLFPSSYWPKGKYIAYPTIWGMFPRFLEDKTFQVAFSGKKKSYINTTIAHELLHFIFYNYFLKKYPKYKNEKYDFLVWHISEIFNELIQNSPKWLGVFKEKTMGYPEHKKIVGQLKKEYYKKNVWNVDVLIKDIIYKATKLV